MTSATAALEIALAVANIEPGDEVITTPMSFCATANVIRRAGAIPVFVDVDLDSRNLLLDQVTDAIGPRTRAIMPVHFAGLPVDMDQLYQLAGRHRLRVIEDAAHAIGSAWNGRRIGSFGDLVCFSFHPNKNMTTGEGGALAVNDAAEAALVEKHRFHGVAKSAGGPYDVAFPGMKANLSDIAARIGLGQLWRLGEFNARRRELVARYYERWREPGPLRLPARGDDGHSWHMFAPLLPAARMPREDFIRAMDQRGISVGVHYPAIHLYSTYLKLGWRAGQFPNAERIGRETLTLPLFPAMSIDDVDRVVDAVNEILGEES
jgi:dTDP-4-amino-4,6-dideoxygalactose transaminase